MINISRRRFSLLLPAFALWLRSPASAKDGPGHSDKHNLLIYRDEQGREQPIRTADDWLMRRKQILAAMQEVMGVLPHASRKVPLAMEVIEEHKTDRYLRRKMTFAVEENDRLAAYLFIPAERV